MPLRVIDPDDLRDDLPRLLDEHRVADPDVELRDHVAVVQRRARHRRPAELHGIEHGDGRQRPGPADLHDDLAHHRPRLLGRELVRDRPLRKLRREPEDLLLPVVVDLHDGAVRLVRIPLARRVDRVDRSAQLLEALHLLLEPVRRDPLLGDPPERLGVARVELRPLDELVEERAERSPRYLARVEHSHRAGRRVPRVGERLEPVGFALGVVLDQILPEDEHLPSERDLPGVRDRERNAADGPHVRRDLLARLPVAARARLDEVPPFVDDLDARPVELRLHAERRGRPRRQPVLHSPHELLQLLVRVRVVEREHPHAVLHLGRPRARLARHALRRRSRRHELRVRRFEGADLAHQRVVLGVGDARIVEHVVAVVVRLDLADELGVAALGGGGRGHLSRARLAERMPRFPPFRKSDQPFGARMM